jgi:catechol 2,3-dioxygenase-like lactoylglutathione lyase family enzyme
MLRDYPAIATVAVKDLAKADQFYSSVLGLKKDDSNPEAITYRSGDHPFLVYRSQFAGSNQATAVNWWVGEELDAIVADLKSRGVTFEHYDLPGVERQDDIHSAGGMRMVWFKDPDGNIHSVMST